ncbi:SIMPL domain-containing protein [bacterium]|nr:SIMPL domain-containing protein [candidate division CSSED10-310 bacterium]
MKHPVYLSICLGIIFISTGIAFAENESLTPSITVTGEAVVEVQPDKVILSFGIETWDKDMKLAKQKNSAILNKALSGVRELGVDESKIQTDHISISPRYDNSYEKKDFIGYFVWNNFSVTLTDMSRLEAVITTVLESGVNYINGINFQTTAFKEHRERARILAMQAAKEKALKMAAAVDQEIGSALQIKESGSEYPYYHSWYGSQRSSTMTQNVIQDMGSTAGSAASDTVALGKISIRASVVVTFLLK